MPKLNSVTARPVPPIVLVFICTPEWWCAGTSGAGVRREEGTAARRPGPAWLTAPSREGVVVEHVDHGAGHFCLFVDDAEAVAIAADVMRRVDA